MINTIEKTLQYGCDYLEEFSKSKDSTRLDASVLLTYVISKPKSYLLTWPNVEVTAGQFAMYKILLERRAKGEPIAYIIGQKEFYSLIFNVTSDTLIPRPETELVVDTVLEYFKSSKNAPLNILDLGTGTGCIAVTLAKLRPNWNVVAVDKSTAALDVASKNAVLNKVSNIKFIESNWFEQLDEDYFNNFDCIVSNPPYIASDDIHLSEGDVSFEPISALVAKNNGLADINIILESAPQYLKPSGLVLIEHGYYQAKSIFELINQNNLYKNYKSISDYAGHDRLLFVTN